MSQISIRETSLPGVGVQHDFETETGTRVGVITHHSGRRDFLIFSPNDPDLCASSTSFTEQESQLLGELFGASKVVETIGHIQQNIAGLAIDWIPVQEGWACNNVNIRGLGLSATGTLIIAVIRGEETIPAPGADFRVKSGDTVVVIGKPEGIRQASELMRGEVT